MIRSHSEKLLQKCHLHVSCAMFPLSKLEFKEEWKRTKTFSLKESLQNCSADHAAAQECKNQLTRSHSAVVTDGTAKAGQC